MRFLRWPSSAIAAAALLSSLLIGIGPQPAEAVTVHWDCVFDAVEPGPVVSKVEGDGSWSCTPLVPATPNSSRVCLRRAVSFGTDWQGGCVGYSGVAGAVDTQLVTITGSRKYRTRMYLSVNVFGCNCVAIDESSWVNL